MNISWNPGSRSRLIFNTIKVAAAISIMAFVAVNWLSHDRLDQHTLGRLAADASRRGGDPVTTGSIGAAARATRLDPCALPARR
jgi:hypothetical protein